MVGSPLPRNTGGPQDSRSRKSDSSGSSNSRAALELPRSKFQSDQEPPTHSPRRYTWSRDSNEPYTSSSTSDTVRPKRTSHSDTAKPRSDNRRTRSGRGGDRGSGRGSGSGAGRGGSLSQKLTKAQALVEAYEAERAAELAPTPRRYEPAVIEKRGDLEGLGPAMLTGSWGMKEMLGKEAGKAQRYFEGRDWIESKLAFNSARDKKEIYDLAGGLKAAKEDQKKGNGNGGEDVLLTKLFSGGYITQRPTLRSSNKQDTLLRVGRLAALNASYELYDEESLLGKVKTLVGDAAMQSKAGAGKEGRQQQQKQIRA